MHASPPHPRSATLACFAGFMTGVVALTPGAAGAADADTGRPLSYNRDVRPILSDKCFQCHGPDANAREADLRLDVREDALAAEAFVPGAPDRSELVHRITTDDEDDVMPPPESNKQLGPDEREILRRWIAEGAEYEPHWAYITPRRPAVPATSAADAPAHPVDAFIRGRLAERGLEPSPEADRRTLLRRLTLDLVGLPPTPAEMAAFLADERPGAFERAVDRLLASPHFGERMAVEWLDVVRYADTVGYHGDQERDVTPYRDYVIASFNANKPFDRFTVEQIAGDLLPDGNRETRVATAFNRLNPLSEEGGIQDAEYLAKYRAERVRTTATAWLGSTMACAECHDHKFDPFTMHDFYAMGAFFADLYEKGAFNGDGRYNEGVDLSALPDITVGHWGPQMAVPTPAQEAELARLAEDRARLVADLEAATPEREAAFHAWVDGIRRSLATSEPRDAVILDDRELPLPAGIEVVSRDKGPVASGEFARRQSGEGTIQHLVELGDTAFTVAAGDRFYAHVRIDPQAPPTQVMLQFRAEGSDWNHRAWWGADEIPYGKGSTGGDHFRAGDLPPPGEWVRLEVDAASVGLAPGARVTEVAYTQFGGTVTWDRSGRATNAAAAALAGIPAELHPALRDTDPGCAPDPAALDSLRNHWRTTAPELADVRRKIEEAGGREKAVRDRIPSTLVTVASTPREVRVLPRGNWMDDSGEIVAPAPPRFLPGAPDPAAAGRRLTRLDFARWLVSRDNPLTARTFVNRVWKQFFGNGISKVLDDLGSQGEWPTHPDLLDWLSVEFMESGWDVKHLVRLLVTSHAYRQGSEATPDQREADPFNRFYARQSPRRLKAEFIRDQALAVSGLLNPEIGGRSARPYQPAGYYRNLNFPRREYQADTDDSQYRRGVYMHWQRTFLHPMLAAFDAPPREECTADRTAANTPLQALDLLNDPTFVEAARAFAARLLSEHPDATADARVRAAFEACLGRPAEDEEAALLVDLLENQRARLAGAPADADALLGVGLLPVPAGVDRVELAATTAVTRALLCLHETITRY